MKKITLLLIVLILFNKGFAQDLLKPNYSTKSHETLELDKITSTKDSTYFNFVLTNRLVGSTFCADRNIVILSNNPTKQYKLIKAIGIPVCPQQYTFAYLLEKMRFTLVFPALDTAIKVVDIYEMCLDACFSYRGVVINKNLNNALETAYFDYSSGRYEKAIIGFLKIIENYPDYNYGITFINIIRIYADLKKLDLAKLYYHKLLNSNVFDKQQAIEIIKNSKYFNSIN